MKSKTFFVYNPNFDSFHYLIHCIWKMMHWCYTLVNPHISEVLIKGLSCFAMKHTKVFFYIIFAFYLYQNFQLQDDVLSSSSAWPQFAHRFSSTKKNVFLYLTPFSTFRIFKEMGYLMQLLTIFYRF